MQIIKKAALENGAHENQTCHGAVLDGWAVVPVDPDTLPNFPFGNFEVEDVDGVPHMVTDSWEPLPLPEPEALSPAQQREEAYNTQPIIEWEGQMLTVTQAATKWYYYAAEGSPKADDLQTLIVAAKETIREQYPDEEVSA